MHYVGRALTELLTFIRGHCYKKADIKDVISYSALLQKINSPRLKYFLSQTIEFNSQSDVKSLTFKYQPKL